MLNFHWLVPPIVLVFLDAFFLNQGILSLLVGLLLLVVGVPMIFATRDPISRHRKSWFVGINLMAVFSVLTLNWANNRMARRRADRIILAVQAFEKEHHEYPSTLEQLVPRYLDHVPQAKFTFAQHSFAYFTTSRGHVLEYVVLPPFGRSVYRFESGAWKSLD